MKVISVAIIAALAVTMIGSTSANAANKMKSTKVWPDGVIVYKFAENVTNSEKEAFIEACKTWAVKTGAISCTEAKPDDSTYVNVRVSTRIGEAVPGIGAGGPRKFQMTRYLFTQKNSMVHELGHVIGLSHEHQRSDRDAWININRRYLRESGYRSQVLEIHNTDNLTEYDYCSAMHYRSTTKMRQRHIDRGYRSIVPRQPLNNCSRLGAYKISDLDCRGVQKMYDAEETGCRQ